MDLKKAIEDWAVDKGIHKPENATRQFLKLVEEYGELHTSYLEEDTEKFRDSVGDCIVVAIILAKQMNVTLELDFTFKTEVDHSYIVATLGKIAEGLAKNTDISVALSKFTHHIISNALDEEHDPQECLLDVYNIISKRKGTTVDGVFIKNEN